MMVPVHAVIECPACRPATEGHCDRCGGARFVPVKAPPPIPKASDVIAAKLKEIRGKLK